MNVGQKTDKEWNMLELTWYSETRIHTSCTQSLGMCVKTTGFSSLYHTTRETLAQYKSLL